MTLRDFFNILFKRWGTLLLVFLLFSVGLSAGAYYWPATYRSQATLYLRSKRETIDQSLAENPTINRVTSLLLEDVLSEVELLSSSSVRQLVIEQLDLANDPIGDGPKDPTVVWDLYLRGNMEAEAAANANVVVLTFTDSDPERAARVVSGYADCYLKYRRALMQDGSIEEDHRELDSSRSNLARLDRELREFDKEWNLIEADSQKSEMLELQRTALAHESELRGELDRLDYELDVYERMLAEDGQDLRHVAEVRASATVELLESQLAELELEMTDLLSHSTLEHKPVQRVSQSIEDVRRSLNVKVQEIIGSIVFAKRTEANAKRAELAAQYRSLEEVAEKLAILQEKSSERGLMALDLGLATDNFKMLSLRLERRRVEDSFDNTGNIDVVVASYGSVPGKPYFPPPLSLVIIVSVVIGLGLALSTVIVLDILDDTFVTPEDVERHLGVVVLGSVPRRLRSRVLRPVGEQ